MNIMEFSEKLTLLNLFITTVNDDNISIKIQKYLIKSYANNLKINLTDRMIGELITN